MEDSTSNYHNKNLGKTGEDAAANYLQRQGYEIVARNWVCSNGEADIIAMEADTLVFVEVKTRMGESCGLPEEAITRAKRSKYEKIAISYFAQNILRDLSVRFDVISITVIGDDRAFLRHHINAFGTGD